MALLLLKKMYKESDFPELTQDEFLEMCNEIKMEIEKNNGCGS